LRAERLADRPALRAALRPFRALLRAERLADRPAFRAALRPFRALLRAERFADLPAFFAALLAPFLLDFLADFRRGLAVPGRLLGVGSSKAP